MKNFTFILAAFCSVLLISACGNGESGNEMDDMKENVEQSTGDAMNSMQQQFLSTVEDQQENMNQQMDDVEAAVDEKGDDLEPGVQARWEELQTQKTEIEEMISDLKSGEFEGFDQIKTDLQDQMSRFKDNIAQLKTDLGL